MAGYRLNITGDELQAILDNATPKGAVGDAPNVLSLQGARTYSETLSKASLICAGTIIAPYTILESTTIGAEVQVTEAFRLKFGENNSAVTKVVLVDKRVVVGEGGNMDTRYIYSGDYEGCYFVMGDFEGNDTIFGLDATEGDWIIAQNKHWVKIVTKMPNNIAKLEDIQQSDYDESDPTSKAYIKNRTHYFRGYTSAQQLVADDTTIGTNLANVGEYFKLGNTVYKSADMVGVEFNCQTSGAPVYVSVVSDVNANGDVVYYLKHISGSSSSGAPIMFITAGEFKALDAVYIPDSFATKDYVEAQIRAAQKETVSISTPIIEALQPNKIYVNHVGRLSNLTISSLETTTNIIDEYTLHFSASGAGLVSLPDYVMWPNGEAPTLAGGAVYELSIIKTTISGSNYFKAVLTQFK